MADVTAAEISREDVLTAVGNGGTFGEIVLRLRMHMEKPISDERVVDRALQRERRAGVIESVARRWRKVEGRGNG